MNLKKSWISEHPHAVIGIILIGCLGPFIDKAIHVDDALFVWTAEWIQKHPLDFFGCEVNWWASSVPMWVANWNPPLMSYFLAGVASLFGWNEIVLHLACLVVAFTAAAGIYSLAKMWCDTPLVATVVAMFTPAFLVSSTTLICDVLMLAFWIWAVVFWERALTGSGQSRWQFVGAGALAGLAVLTKYSAVTLLPLLPILSILRTRKLGWWLAGLVVPLIMVAGYEWITASIYGKGLLSAASYHARTFRVGFPGGWKAKGIISLTFAGGSLLPLLFFSPLLWRRQVLLAGGFVIFGVWLGMFKLWNNLGLSSVADLSMLKHGNFLLQVALLTVGGLHLLLLVAAEICRRRDPGSIILALWIISGLLFATVLNWTVSARSFLPIVPAAAILLARRLGATRGNSEAGGWLLWPLIPAAAIALGIVIADCHLANSARTAADQITAKYKSAGHQMWFEGHGAFQYYMEKLGGEPIDVERSLLQPGDVVVVPWIGSRVPFPVESVGWLEGLAYCPFSWMNLMGSTEHGAAGFYGANLGPVPFAIGRLPRQDYFVVKVFSRVQFNTPPVNQREVQAGDVPSFPYFSSALVDKITFPCEPEAIKQTQLAGQLEADGKVAEAIQHYREALNVDSNNPVVLNNLAWILATASRPELRNGEEAVQLATKAVKLTDRRLPLFIETLAAAYAETGQFSKAAQITQTARILAILVNQPDVIARIDRLSSLYAGDRAAEATQTNDNR